MRFPLSSVAALSLLPLALAAPAPAPVAATTPEDAVSASAWVEATSIEDRGLIGGVVGLVGGLAGALIDDVNKAVAAADPNGVVNALVQIKPSKRPTSVNDVVARESAIWASPTGRHDFFSAVATQVAVGLGPLLDNTLKTVLTGGLPVGENSPNNNNPAPPSNIYPKSQDDASYSVPEAQLRSAIYIPKGFTGGAKTPVLFVPGTGAYGGANFASNIRKLLTGTDFADPVWLNVPGAMLGDTQTNAEYVAYAINYISSISKRDIAVVSWSQGGLDTQWALKYWPSTRTAVSDFLPVSPDFKGTVLANLLCLSSNSDTSVLCDPAVIQQEATSKYVAALRRDGGDSAYVPTTSFYSGLFDEIVQPQSGVGASAYMQDARRVGVTNVEVQVACAGGAGGSFYGHAGLLVNPIVYALIVDALTHDGPGKLERIADRASVCATYAAQGLDLDDVLATTGLIPIAAVLLLTYPEKLTFEPPLRSYAR